jgi:hypothetical protein
MPTPTYDLISATTLAVGAPEVAFESIPQGYRDLAIVITGQLPSGGEGIGMRFNGDAGNNYPFIYSYGDGNGAYSGNGSATRADIGLLYGAGRSSGVAHIMDYSVNDKQKTLLSRFNAYGVNEVSNAIRWTNTAPITRVGITVNVGNLPAGATFNLYGIVA